MYECHSVWISYMECAMNHLDSNNYNNWWLSAYAKQYKQNWKRDSMKWTCLRRLLDWTMTRSPSLKAWPISWCKDISSWSSRCSFLYENLILYARWTVQIRGRIINIDREGSLKRNPYQLTFWEVRVTHMHKNVSLAMQSFERHTTYAQCILLCTFLCLLWLPWQLEHRLLQ